MCVLMGLVLKLMLLFHIGALFVFFFCLLKHLRRSQAAFRREVANVANDVPGFLVRQNAFPSWHTTKSDAIVDDPLQLTISVLLHAR